MMDEMMELAETERKKKLQSFRMAGKWNFGLEGG